MKWKRIITHTDMDGVVSAMLLREVFDIKEIIFKEPSDIQNEIFIPEKTDIVCDLPKSGGMWFDHHPNQENFEGNEGRYDPFEKSAARIIFNKFYDKLKQYSNLINEVDKIDSANYTIEEYLNPNPTQKISISIKSFELEKDNKYRLYLIEELSNKNSEEIILSNLFKNRYNEKIKNWDESEKIIQPCIKKQGNIIIVNTVSLNLDSPHWRIHKLYIDNPDVDYIITARLLKVSKDVKISIGSNIFASQDRKNKMAHLGKIATELGGGGHKGIGGLNTKYELYEEYLSEIVKKIKEGEEEAKWPYKLYKKGDNFWEFRKNLNSICESFTVTAVHDGTIVLTGDYGTLTWKRNIYPDYIDYFPNDETGISYFAEKVCQHNISQVIMDFDRDAARDEIEEVLMENFSITEADKEEYHKDYKYENLNEIKDDDIKNKMKAIELMEDMGFENQSEMYDQLYQYDLIECDLDYGMRYTKGFKFLFELAKYWTRYMKKK